MTQKIQEQTSLLYNLYKEMAPDQLTYIYRGNFSKSLNDGILSLSESNLNNISEDSKVKKKVYYLMVESLQNITRHEDKTNRQNQIGESFFVIQRRKNAHLITSGNVIENLQINPLIEKLNKVNSLSPESLKEYYIEVLAKGELTANGGAGLGLIEMARKSGNKLSYDFVKLNDSISFFYYQIKISNQSQDLDVEKGEDHMYFENAKTFHHRLVDQQLNLIYHGFFSQDNLKNILGMIESGLGSKDSVQTRKKVFNILVEAMQNIFKHENDDTSNSEGREGIFTIGKSNGIYQIAVGNKIRKNRIDALKAKLELVNNSDLATLNKLYDEVIMSDTISEGNGAGLGLIDMKLKSGRNLIYDFQNMDLENAFYSLQIDIEEIND